MSADLAIRHIARALVFDPADRLLLIEYKAVRPAPTNPDAENFWFMPGGGLEPGETHEEACRRELGEEIGVEDAVLGPQVAACDGPFHLFDKSRDARERYFVVRLPDDRIDTSRLAETEDNPVIGTRWWPLDELAGSGVRVEPAGLVDLACRIARGEIPDIPKTLMWWEPDRPTAVAIQASPKPQRSDRTMFPEVLTEGYRSFLGERLPQERQKYETLAKGQSPEVLLIGCCDSRVAPEVIFNVGPGEIFTIRNVANIVPPYEEGGGYHGTSSAIEFAVQGLKVKHIVVLGHATCGGIKAYATGAEPLSQGNFIGKWVSLVEPASKALEAKGDTLDKPDYLTRLEYASIAQSLKNLMTFGFIRERVEAGELHLHGAHFGIEQGELRIRDPKTGDFESVVAGDGATLKTSALIGCTEA